jgi:putative hydrolase of the HAD superfamily
LFQSDLTALIFDVGGTLLRLDYEAMIQLAAKRSQRLEESTLRRAESDARRKIDARAQSAESAATGTDAERLLPYFCDLLHAAGIADEVAAEIARDLAALHVQDNLWRVPMPGALETLRGLRARGLRVAALSNADGRVAELLRVAGLAEDLDLVLDSHLEGVEKPDPEIFRRALSRLEVPAERAAYIGDIYSIDAVGARAAGLRPVIIDPSSGYPPLDCPKIADLRELLPAVDRAREAR